MHILRVVVLVGAIALLAGCGGAGDDGSVPAPGVEAATAVVPHLVGRHMSVAHRLARRSGFSIRWMGFAGRLANGRYIVPCVKVLRQSPAPGERRPRGGQIAVIEIACHVPQNKVHDAFH